MENLALTGCQWSMQGAELIGGDHGGERETRGDG